MIYAWLSVLVDLEENLTPLFRLFLVYENLTHIIEHENKPNFFSLCELIGQAIDKYPINIVDKDQGKILTKIR